MPLLTEIRQEPYLTAIVWQINTDEQLIVSGLSEFDKNMLSHINVEVKRQQFWASRHILYNMLQAKKISYLNTGKPYSENLYISNSHSGNFVAGISSKINSVGIDIQLYDTKVERIKSRFLHPDESHYDIGIASLTMAWCLKESVYKIHGVPDIFFKEHIRLGIPKLISENKFQVICNVTHEGYLSEYVMKVHTEKDYCLAFGPVK